MAAGQNLNTRANAHECCYFVLWDERRIGKSIRDRFTRCDFCHMWQVYDMIYHCRSVLRTVLTIVIAHTFCASPDTRISYRWCLLIQGYFCAVWNYPEKVDLSKHSWYSKRKLGVTMHFSEIIKLQFAKERLTLLCILKLFTNIIHELSLKNAWLPPILFLDFNNTC